MGDKDGKHVLMCSWGKKNDPALGMDFTAPSEKLAHKDEIPTEVSLWGSSTKIIQITLIH